MSLYITTKALGLGEPTFIEYAVCRKCHKLHVKCRAAVGDDKKRCAHVQPYQRGPVSCEACEHRRPRPAAPTPACDSKEEKKQAHNEEEPLPVTTRECCGIALFSGDKRPRLSYCYQPLSKRLAQLLARPGFEVSCERWRKTLHEKPPGIMADLTHGAIWQRLWTCATVTSRAAWRASAATVASAISARSDLASLHLVSTQSVPAPSYLDRTASD